MKRLGLFVFVSLVGMQSLQPLTAFAATRDGQRGNDTEYYTMTNDQGKLSITGSAGEYSEDVKFTEIDPAKADAEERSLLEGGVRIFNADTNPIPITDTDQTLSNQGDSCKSMPTIHWEKDNDKPADQRKKILRLLLLKNGSIVVDISRDYNPNDGVENVRDAASAAVTDGLLSFNPIEGYSQAFTALSNIQLNLTGDGNIPEETGTVRWGKLGKAYQENDQQHYDGEKPPADTSSYGITYQDRLKYKMTYKRYVNTPDRLTPKSYTGTGLNVAGAKAFGLSGDPITKILENDLPDINTPDRVRLPDGHKTINLGDKGTLECAYSFFDHFWRVVTPYNTLNPQAGQLAGKLLGKDDMKFEDWARNGDNRLVYQSYKYSAQQESMEHCANKDNSYDCVARLGGVRLDCQAKSIEATQEITPDIFADIKNPVWEKSFKKDAFIDCYKSHKELTDSKYFRDEADLADFAKRIIDNAILPPSLNPKPAPKVPEKMESAPSDTRCSLGMLGWILCPVMSFMATVNDKVYNILKGWLILAPFQVNGTTNSAAFDVWGKMRNIANIAFVIAFIYMIYAQITGKASSPGGLRSRMPRIIIAALLANASYVICGVVVDIVNVLGDSLFRILVNSNVQGSAITQYGSFEALTASITLGGGAAAGTWVVIANLAALVPILLAACIALVGTLLMLLFRQAAIIILVVISPLAFAVLALPSFDRWFDKWKGIFLQLLMIYPLFAILFGGGNMVAEIIRSNAAQNGDVLMTIFSLGIQVLPLFLIPFIIKLGGGVIAQVGGIVNDPNKGPLDALRKRAGEFRDDRKTQQRTRALNGRWGVPGYGAAIRRNERRKARDDYLASSASGAASTYAGKKTGQRVGSVAGKALNRLSGIPVGKLGQIATDDLLTDAQKAALEKQEIAEATIQSSTSPEAIKQLDEIFDPNKSVGDQQHTPEKSASIKRAVESGDLGTIDKLIDNLHKLDATERKVLVETIKASGIVSSAAHLNSKNLGMLENSNYSGGAAGLYRQAAADGFYSADTISNQSADSLRGLEKAHQSGAVSSSQYSAVAQAYRTVQSNPKLSSQMQQGAHSQASTMFRGHP